MRNLDLVVLAVALPVFVLADLPLLGYAAAAVAWIAQALLQRAVQARLARTDRRTSALGLVGGSMVARLWILTAAILLVGLIGDEDAGLAAAVLAAVLVTADLAGEAIARALSEPEASG